jgi:hypothetical protein
MPNSARVLTNVVVIADAFESLHASVPDIPYLELAKAVRIAPQIPDQESADTPVKRDRGPE